MNNVQRQMKLDDEKWYASQKAGKDRAGAMSWCNFCKFQSDNKCSYGNKPTDKIRVKYPCATAYNKMKKEEDKQIANKHGIR